jgi:hypothetical protein
MWEYVLDYLAQDRVQWRALVEDGSEPLGFVKEEKSLDQLSYTQLLKKGCVPYNQLLYLVKSLCC